MLCHQVRDEDRRGGPEQAGPFGIGVGLGAGAKHLVARSIIKQSRRVLGPPPVSFLQR